jgi:hypothetical protein
MIMTLLPEIRFADNVAALKITLGHRIILILCVGIRMPCCFAQTNQLSLQ